MRRIVVLVIFGIILAVTQAQDNSTIEKRALVQTWLSGASQNDRELLNGQFGAWRGEPAPIAGTWSDATIEGQVNQWSLDTFPGWTGDLDLAVGGIYDGESWSAAANGAYELRWRQCLQAIYSKWQQKRTIYIRFAHEFNGDWFKWSVNAGNVDGFKLAWRRFYALVQQELVNKGKSAKLVWSPGDGSKALPAEQMWPGDAYVDVIGVDTYDWWPTRTPANWDSVINMKDGWGGPQGMEQWRLFALAHGKPISFPEWGLNAANVSDNPFYIQKMNEWFRAHAGTGAGQVLYEVYFNVWDQTRLYPTTTVPNSAAMYKSLNWGQADSGSTQPPVVTTKPSTGGAPTNVVAVSSATDKATISWAPPTSGTVSQYRVGRDGSDSTGHGAWSDLVSSTARSQTFVSLIPDTGYSVFVEAVFADGTTGPRVTVSVHTLSATGTTKPPTVAPTTQKPTTAAPSNVPTSVSAVATATDKAILSWAPPVSGTVSQYRIGRDGSDSSGYGPWSDVVPATARSQTFLFLIPDTDYHLFVEAVFADGTTSQRVTVPVHMPSSNTQKPTTVSPTTQKATTVSPTTQKATTVSPTTQKATTVSPTTQKPTTSAPTTQKPTTAAPSNAPTNVKAVPNSSDQATISWTPPTSGTVSQYNVGRDGSDSSGYGAWSGLVPSTARSQTFLYLLPNTDYNVFVEAVFADGTTGQRVTVRVHTLSSTPSPTTGSTQPPATLPSGYLWLSGASGADVANGGWASWRGEPTPIATTWNSDALEWHLQQVTLAQEYGAWTGDLDNSIGAIYEDSGETWESAATGAYDARWRQVLQKINTNWLSKKTLYLRFAHEFNGNWYPWSVRSASAAAGFKTAWCRFYKLVQEELVAKGRKAKVTWGPTFESKYMSAESLWPGSQCVDVVGVDFYDWWPVHDANNWDAEAIKKDGWGGPRGIEAWRQFALSKGKPFALPEWGLATFDTPTDNPWFVQRMHDYIRQYAGSGPGQILYECYFSAYAVTSLYPSTQTPNSAAKYKSLTWGLPLTAAKAETGSSSSSSSPHTVVIVVVVVIAALLAAVALAGVVVFVVLRKRKATASASDYALSQDS